MSRLHPALHLLVAVLTLVLQGTALAQPSAPTITKRVYLPLVACTGCTGSVSASPQQPAPVVPAPVDAAAYATRFLQLVNERRAAVGCPAAVLHPVLMQATGDIAARWGQDRPVGEYATYGYPAPVAETAIPSDSAPTPEQALITGFWVDTLTACLPAGSPTGSYDMGIGIGKTQVILALSANFYTGRMVSMVNVARVAAGCPAAEPHPALMQATQDWSTYMRTSGDYSHGDYWVFDKKYAAYPGVGVYENISGGSMTPEVAFDEWFNSPLHKRNMLWCYPPSDPSYLPGNYEMGVGYNDGYWTLAMSAFPALP